MKFITNILAILLAFPLCSHAAPDPLAENFKNPPHSAGIRAFWWWLNGNVTQEGITRDLEQMKAKGFNGAMIFDADGSSQRGNTRVPAGPTFASPEWTKLFVHTCKEANRLDLELSLNLQSGWNLGGPNVTEEESTQHLVWSKTTVQGPAKVAQKLVLPVKPGRFYRDVAVLAVPLTDGKPIKIKDLALKTSTKELGMSAPDTRHLLQSPPAKPGEKFTKSQDIINLTGSMAKDGTLTWDAPAGTWEILRIGHSATGAHVSTESVGWSGRVLDYLAPSALDAYWQRNIDPIFQAIGPLAGKTLRYTHTDSWEGGGMNWTPGFETTFRQQRGYDLTPWLAVITGHVLDDHETTTAFLADFRKTIGGLVADHYGHLAKLSARYGMGIHPESAGPHAGPLDGLKNYGHSEIMMSEFWSPSPHRVGPDNRFFVKQASSAAHTYGKRLVGAEGFTTIGPHWNDSPWSQMKPSFDTEIAAGLNLLFVHTFTASPPEMGLPGQEYFAGTHFNPQITWWDESTAFINYLRRCQYLAQQGKFVADVVHYYGDHIPNIFSHKGKDPAGALPGYDFDVLSEDLLLDALAVKDGRLTLPSGMTYRLLSLPDHRVLSLGAIKKIHSLVRDGATVLGPKPAKMVSLEGGAEARKTFHALADELWGKSPADPKGIRPVGKGRICWGHTASELLQADTIPHDADLLQADGKTAPATDWIHYRIDDADVYFIAELDGKPRTLNARFRVTGKIPEIWDAVDGSTREAATFWQTEHHTVLPIVLGPYDSRFIVFRKPTQERQRSQGPNQPTWQEKLAIPGSWTVQFDPKWGGPADPVRFDTLTDWLQHSDPAIRDYSGKAIYRSTINIPEKTDEKKLALELGNILSVGIARVRIDGQDLGIRWRPPYRYELPATLAPGNRPLEVTIINSWHNRVMADEKLPPGKRLARTNIRPTDKSKFAWKPEPSGLLGPVRIVEKID